MTPPYFHDGAIITLSEAVGIVAKVQLEKDCSARCYGYRNLPGKPRIIFAKCLYCPLALRSAESHDRTEALSTEGRRLRHIRQVTPARVSHDANHFEHANFDQLRRERSLSSSAQQRIERCNSRRGSGSERL